MGVLLKAADARGVDRLAVIRVNYAVAAVIAFFAAVLLGQSHVSRAASVLAAAVGVLFVGGLICWAKAIETGGLALSVVAMRSAIAVPVLASIVVWHEAPSGLEIVGSVLAVAALVLVISELVNDRTTSRTDLLPESGLHIGQNLRKPESGSGSQAGVVPADRVTGRPWLWMLGLFLVNGLVNTAAKLFQEKVAPEENLPFQAVIFVAAFLVTTVLYYVRKSRVSQPALRYGAALGAANLGNYLFLILALTTLPGTVVYPVAAALEVGLMAMAGSLLWREKVGLRSWVGIGLAIISLVLIQLGRVLPNQLRGSFGP